MKFDPRGFAKHLQNRIRLNRNTFIVYSILRVLVILTAIRSFFQANFEGLALCLLSLLLFLLPAFFEERLKVDIPPLFEAVIYCFIFAAEIMGEVNHYYTAIPGWDTMLHVLNGFLCAAIGFSLVEMLNRNSSRMSLSPLYLAIVSFCFSMTIGVVWEFIEFSADQVFYLDMQKDFIIRDIGSVTMDVTRSQIPFRISGITRTIIETRSGQSYIVENGYLDVGIVDTMKDLLVNLVGALVFSVFGYLYEKSQETSGVAGKLILRMLSDSELEEQDKEMERQQEMVRLEKERRRLRRKSKAAGKISQSE